MRTGHGLFHELTADDAAPDSAGAVRKGRNAELLARRNSRLLDRYLYYCLYTNLRPQQVNAALEQEFDLTERHLLAVIYEHAEDLRKMRATPPTIAELRARYPHMVWLASKP